MRRLLLGMFASLVLAGYDPASVVASDDEPLLRQAPEVADGLARLPGFLRDTDLRLHLRSYYLNSRTPLETMAEAWAAGGWLSYRSGWLLETFQMGATIFTSIPLYAPGDRDGTLLLRPGQRGFIVPGVAFGALRYEDYALLTGYRQLVEQTYVNGHDDRMAPNTFEGVTLGGNLGGVQYLVGYLTGMKERNADTFVSMAEAAGVHHNSGGLVIAGAHLAPLPGLRLEVSNQYGHDVFNTAFAQVDYQYALAPGLSLTVSAQYTDQRAVGDASLGGSKFTRWATSAGGAKIRVRYEDLTLLGAFSVTDTGSGIRTPFGVFPGYLHMIVRDFNRAGEIAWRVDASYALPPPVHQVRAALAFARGVNAIDPVRRTPAPEIREYNAIVDVHPSRRGVLRGLGFTAAAGIVDVERASKLQYQIRLILNYEFQLL